MSSRCTIFRDGACAAALILLLSSSSPAQERSRPLEPAGLLSQADLSANQSSTLPTACEIIYHDGQLMIHAQNSTLADVLRAVAEKTGAVIDIPPGSGLDRIFEKAGPGPADAVLSSLLNGSAFDFIIVNSPESPHVPTRVLLLPRGPVTSNSAPPTVASVPSASEPQLYGAGFRVNPEDDDSSSLEAPVPNLASESPSAQGDVIPGEVLDRMQKERILQRQQQLQQQVSPARAQ